MLLDASEDSQFLFQWPCTLIMDNIVDLHHDIFSIMLLIASIVFFLIFRIIVEFQAGGSNIRGRSRIFGFNHHTTLEIVWTLIPMLVLMLILVPSFVLLYCIDELHDFQVTFNVIGRQWYWTYEFSTDLFPVDASGLENSSGNNLQLKLFSFDSYLLPDLDLPFGGFRLLEVDNRVNLPVEVHINTLITSTDVLHSWAVPSFGVNMDACPGRLNQVSLFIYRLGVFYGQCSEICGINHGFMPVVVESILANKYSSWVFSSLNNTI